MPNISSGTTAHQMYDPCNDLREAFLLYWDNYVVYSDNTSSLIGQRNSLLQRIRNAQGDQKIFVI